MRFRATLESSGKTATGIQIPADIVEALGSGKRPAVRITIGGHTYRSTVATRPTEQAKKPETRRRRVEKAVSMLRAGRKR